MASTLTRFLDFFCAGLFQHGQTGGIVPSQGFLIARMMAPIPQDYRGLIIELGTGTGTLTRQLAARCPEARILGCEINPILARDSRDRISKAGFAGRVEVATAPAERLLSEFPRLGEGRPGFIISGIPMGNLGRQKANALLDSIRQALGVGGMYIQFQHSLLDRKKIRARFPNTRTIPVFWNFPPAVVYYAQ